MTRELSPIEVSAEGLRALKTSLDAFRAACQRNVEVARDWAAFYEALLPPPKTTVRDRLKRAGVAVDFDMIWRTR